MKPDVVQTHQVERNSVDYVTSVGKTVQEPVLEIYTLDFTHYPKKWFIYKTQDIKRLMPLSVPGYLVGASLLFLRHNQPSPAFSKCLFQIPLSSPGITGFGEYINKIRGAFHCAGGSPPNKRRIALRAITS